MHVAARTIIVATGVVGLIGSAFAAEMKNDEIKSMITGKTLYVENTDSAVAKSGKGVIYWKEDGTSLYRTPSGAVWHGKWEVRDNKACTDWKEKPGNACIRYDKTGDTILVIDVPTGQTRSKVVKTAPGNAENLAP